MLARTSAVSAAAGPQQHGLIEHRLNRAAGFSSAGLHGSGRSFAHLFFGFRAATGAADRQQAEHAAGGAVATQLRMTFPSGQRRRLPPSPLLVLSSCRSRSTCHASCSSSASRSLLGSSQPTIKQESAALLAAPSIASAAFRGCAAGVVVMRGCNAACSAVAVGAKSLAWCQCWRWAAQGQLAWTERTWRVVEKCEPDAAVRAQDGVRSQVLAARGAQPRLRPHAKPQRRLRHLPTRQPSHQSACHHLCAALVPVAVHTPYTFVVVQAAVRRSSIRLYAAAARADEQSALSQIEGEPRAPAKRNPEAQKFRSASPLGTGDAHAMPLHEQRQDAEAIGKLAATRDPTRSQCDGSGEGRGRADGIDAFVHRQAQPELRRGPVR